MDKLVYNSFSYSQDHWAVNVQENERKYIVRYVSEGGYNFRIMLNPTDCRGYRTIITYVGNNLNHQITDTFNRRFTNEERTALLAVTSKICTCFEEFELITQIEVAGNNSHTFSNGILYAGTEKEPSLLHSHIICRGDPLHMYIGLVPLRGAMPGELFNMREGKIKWSGDEPEQIVNVLNNTYDLLFSNNEEFDYNYLNSEKVQTIQSVVDLGQGRLGIEDSIVITRDMI